MIWRSSSEGVEVNVKAVVTLLNREFFGENRSFTLNRACFTKDNSRQGNLSFIKIADLLTHRPRFTDHNGEFQVGFLLHKKSSGTYLTKVLYGVVGGATFAECWDNFYARNADPTECQ